MAMAMAMDKIVTTIAMYIGKALIKNLTNTKAETKFKVEMK